MSEPNRKPLSPEEYLRWESLHDERFEYDDGELIALAGAKHGHERIVGNLILAVGAQVRAAGCDFFKGDTKVALAGDRRFYYPDFVVTCDPRDTLGTDASDLIRHPVLVVEVLSERTMRRDFTTKLRNYLALPSLREHVLIDVGTVWATIFRRDDGGEWSQVEFAGADSMLHLASIGVSLPLTALYERVDAAPHPIRPLDRPS